MNNACGTGKRENYHASFLFAAAVGKSLCREYENAGTGKRIGEQSAQRGNKRENKRDDEKWNDSGEENRRERRRGRKIEGGFERREPPCRWLPHYITTEFIQARRVRVPVTAENVNCRKLNARDADKSRPAEDRLPSGEERIVTRKKSASNSVRVAPRLH